MIAVALTSHLGHKIMFTLMLSCKGVVDCAFTMLGTLLFNDLLYIFGVLSFEMKLLAIEKGFEVSEAFMEPDSLSHYLVIAVLLSPKLS